MATLKMAARFSTRLSMMLKRYSAFVLLSALLATAASARDECKEAEEQHESAEQQLQSARLGSSEAATEYSTCVEDQGPENCGDEHSKLQSAQDDLKTAISGYKSARSEYESGCNQQPDQD